MFLFQYFLYPQHLAVFHKIRSDKHRKGDVEDDEGHVADGVESDDVSSGQAGQGKDKLRRGDNDRH